MRLLDNRFRKPIFLSQVSLYSPRWPGTHCEQQASLQLSYPPASASLVLRLKEGASKTSSLFILELFLLSLIFLYIFFSALYYLKTPLFLLYRVNTWSIFTCNLSCYFLPPDTSLQFIWDCFLLPTYSIKSVSLSAM